jgi:hypothetical protein
MEQQYWAYILWSLSGTLYITIWINASTRSNTAPFAGKAMEELEEDHIERQNPRAHRRVRRIAQQSRAAAASGSFDSGVRPPLRMTDVIYFALAQHDTCARR